MTRKWKPVTENYLGNKIGDGQNPDEPGDQHSTPDMVRVVGRGATGGGSKPTPQAHRSGSGTLGSSAPKAPQKIRG